MASHISPQIQNEDENQTIDRIFAFVKHESMETPKSSIITRNRSMSTPRRPLATSTPLMQGISQSPLISRPLHLTGNSPIIQPRHIGPAGDMGTSNSNNSATTTSSAPVEKPLVPLPKMNEAITRAINQQQLFQSKCRAILSEIAFQQDQMVQAYEIISLCQKKLAFNGTFQEMSAQRTLLVANERRFVLHRQLEKLKREQIDCEPSTPILKDATRDTNDSRISIDANININRPIALNIMSIKVLLNRSFYIKTVDEDISFALMVICKTDAQIYATQLMNVMDMGTLRVSAVQFRESIRFQNLQSDSNILVEIYALKIMKRPASSRYVCASKIANRAKALIGGGQNKKNLALVGSVPHYPTSDFRRCGFIYLNAQSKGKQQFLLEEVEYPLEGTVELRCEYF